MADRDGSGVADELAELEAAMTETGAVTQAFAAEITRMQGVMAATGRDAEVLSKGLSRGLRQAFDGLVFDGMRASDALQAVARSAISTAYSAAMKPVATHFGGMLAEGIAGLFAGGGSFSQGRVMPFASGGVVSGPTMFPMRGGMGLMGEAGPEAIMPLTRGADGRLGVRAEGGGRAVQVVVNVSTPDVQGFRRSEAQIAAQMSRALGRAQRTR